MSISNSKVTVIIPAFNEEARIETVLMTMKHVDIVDEIIVVNDGSTDDTAAVVERCLGVRLINKKTNEGKGAALVDGVNGSDGDILVFVDADLVGLEPKHIEDMVRPLLEDSELMMTVGKFSGGRLRTDLPQTLVPFISGQRALRRCFVEGVDLASTRFAIEMALTKHAQKTGAKVEEVIMNDVTHIMKEEKMGFARGAWARLGMYSDMVRHYLSTRS
jgi:glycosyltransferase involved in cell wall biosynthesis